MNSKAPLYHLKHRSLPICWPAAVYASYTNAIEVTHDVSCLREKQSVLLKDQIIIYFFGVGPAACFAQDNASTPNVQLMIEDSKAIECLPYGDKDTFISHCKTAVIDKNVMENVMKDPCFLRAMEESSRYAELCSDEVAKFFMNLLQSSEADKFDSDSSPTTNTAPDLHIIFTQNPDLVVQCWKILLQNGWGTITQNCGKVLYKKPTTTFLNFKPNENIFETVEDACVHAFRRAIAGMESEDTSEIVSCLLASLWNHMLKLGWTTIQVASDCWYIKPCTRFQECVPNVTMFDSMLAACQTYLNGETIENQTKEKVNTLSKETILSQTKEKTVKPRQKSRQRAKTIVATIESEEIEPKEGSQTTVAPSKTVKEVQLNLENQTKLMTESESSAQKKTPTKPLRASTRTYTPFKLTFGKIENELRERGWYWKLKGLGYAYYMPHCNSMEENTLVEGKDYFVGSVALEEYIESCGLRNDIEIKLRNEHFETDDTSDSFYPSVVKRKNSASRGSAKKRKSAQTPESEKETSNKALSSRTRAIIEMQENESDKKLFERTVWPQLYERGWRCHPGKFGYDYTKPNRDDRKNLINGFEIFHTDLELIEHLKLCELWEGLCGKNLASDTQSINTVQEKASPNVVSCDSVSMTPKSKENSSSETPLARNLANAFSPSPSKPDSLLEYAKTAITHLQRSYVPLSYLHREKEIAAIESFLSRSFTQRSGGILYISGVPGSGKSAVLESVTQAFFQAKKAKVLRLNAISSDGSSIIQALAKKLSSTQSFDTVDAAFACITSITERDSQVHCPGVLFLDEIDYLIHKENDSDLHRLLELVYSLKHHLLIIGTSNQSDLHDRRLAQFVSRFQALSGPDAGTSIRNKTHMLVFETYSFQSIENILMERLGGPEIAKMIVNAHGLSFLARKVAAMSGDIRIALDITRRILQRHVETADESVSLPIKLNDMLHMVKQTLEGRDAAAVQSLPRNRQLVLYAILRLAQNSAPTAALSMEQIMDSYREISEKCGALLQLQHSVFQKAMEELRSQGLIALTKQRVRLLPSQQDLDRIFEQVDYFNTLFYSARA